MRDFKYLDPISLKAFYFAAEIGHFTRAADAANITQSGLSQHIRKLENELDVDLFIRTGKSVSLSEAGKKLKKFSEQYFDQNDLIFDEIKSSQAKVEGRVRYAMPASCLMTPHFPLLLEQKEVIQNIELDIKICHSPEVIDLLLKNEIDFGFVTETVDSLDISAKVFAEEEYVLVGSMQNQKVNTVEDLMSLRWVNYPGMDVLYAKWFRSCFNKKNQIPLHKLKVMGQINDLAGAMTMVKNGIGVAVLPKHCVAPYIENKSLIDLSNKITNSRMNSIYLIKHAGVRVPKRVQAVIDIFWAMVSS